MYRRKSNQSGKVLESYTDGKIDPKINNTKGRTTFDGAGKKCCTSRDAESLL